MRIGRDEARCTGCKTCQLVCALEHFSEHNPKKAAIGIRGEFPSPGRYKISMCTQCGKCIEVCPTDAISNDAGVIKIDPEKCTYCLACVDECPFGAIFTHREFTVPFICDVCGECVEICPTKALYWTEPR